MLCYKSFCIPYLSGKIHNLLLFVPLPLPIQELRAHIMSKELTRYCMLD